jgi:hypothetical protein
MLQLEPPSRAILKKALKFKVFFFARRKVIIAHRTRP